MNSHELSLFWEEILKQTKVTIPLPIWEKIIYTGLFPYQMEKGVLILCAMHSYMKNLINGNPDVINALQQAASNIFQDTVQIQIVLLSDTMHSNFNAFADQESPKDANFLEDTLNEPLQDTFRESTRESHEETKTFKTPIVETSKTVNFDKDPLPTYDNSFGNSITDENPYSPEPIEKVTYQEEIFKGESDRTAYQTSLSLNKEFTFDNFIVGDSNRLAYSTALCVAENPGDQDSLRNPLYIYGESGLGKTHLMHAVGNYIVEHHPHLKVICITSEDFVNDLINSISSKDTEQFRKTYRDVDVLLVDDIQFIANKLTSQQEFFNTFNALISEGKQIILTSDIGPANLDNIPSRLKSRFAAGIVALIEHPDLETRTAILRTLLEKEKIKHPHIGIPDETITFLASKIDKNIRILEGAFKRVVNAALLSDTIVNTDSALNLVKDIIGESGYKPLNIETIQETVSEYFKIKESELLGNKRNKQIVLARQIAMYLCRHLVSASYPSIAESFGKKDHTTVLHAYEKINRLLDKNRETKLYIEDIISMLKKKCL